MEKLIDKYLKAESTLEEEKEYFDEESGKSNQDLWSSYVKKSRIEAPDNINDSVWEAIQSVRNGKNRLIYGLVAVAASVALILAFSINSAKQKNNNYEEKAALLTEALSMFQQNEQKEEQRNIIYEDELIIIYTSPN